MGPSVSVVVVNWNGKHLLEACLGSLRRQTWRSFTVAVVDNASTDGSADFVKERFPEVEVIAMPENHGFGSAANEGIRRTQSRYVALLNQDAEADSRWLEELVRALEENPEVGFCASRMLLFHNRSIVDSAGDGYTPLGAPYNIGRGLPNDGRFDRPRKVFGACAGAAMYRRALFEDIGLFDEDFFLIFEDVDLSFRAQLAGYQCLYVPSAIVYHVAGATLPKGGPTHSYYCARNDIVVLLKNMPGALLWQRWPLLVAGLAKRTLGGLVYRDKRATLRGRWAALKQIRVALHKRRQVQHLRRVPPAYIASLFKRRGEAL